MRKEDKEAIIRAVKILGKECDSHQFCKGCRLFISGRGCALDKPPAHLDAEEIIKCFT